MTRTDIQVGVSALGTPAWIVPFCYDETYARPQKDWLINTFGHWFFSRWGRYERKNDCDNFARAYCVYAQESHAETDSDSEACAVGEFCYIREDGVAHAIVLAFTDKGPIFIEPQTTREIILTPKEVLSCFRVSF